MKLRLVRPIPVSEISPLISPSPRVAANTVPMTVPTATVSTVLSLTWLMSSFLENPSADSTPIRRRSRVSRSFRNNPVIRADTARPKTSDSRAALRNASVTYDRVCFTYSCIGTMLACLYCKSYSAAIVMGSAPPTVSA